VLFEASPKWRSIRGFFVHRLQSPAPSLPGSSLQVTAPSLQSPGQPPAPSPYGIL
jgi:hypothetical protein